VTSIGLSSLRSFSSIRFATRRPSCLRISSRCSGDRSGRRRCARCSYERKRPGRLPRCRAAKELGLVVSADEGFVPRPFLKRR